MTNSPDRSPSASTRDHPKYPLHKIVAAVAPAATDAVVAALVDAGFARDLIGVVTAEDVTGLDEPVGGSGFRGFLTRLNLSLGDDLDGIERARQELKYGDTLILVMVDGDAEQDRAHAVLRQHGGHSMRYFGQWTIQTFDDAPS